MEAKLTNGERMQRRAIKIIKASIIKTRRFEVKRAGSFPYGLEARSKAYVSVTL